MSHRRKTMGRNCGKTRDDGEAWLSDNSLKSGNGLRKNNKGAEQASVQLCEDTLLRQMKKAINF
jgi:hypothetical protein